MPTIKKLKPSQWNTLGKEYILRVFDKMSTETKARFHRYINDY